MRITVHRTLADTTDCPSGTTCPAVITVDQHPERRYVILKKETDPVVLAALAPYMAEDEQVGWTPRSLFPEIETTTGTEAAP